MIFKKGMKLSRKKVKNLPTKKPKPNQNKNIPFPNNQSKTLQP